MKYNEILKTLKMLLPYYERDDKDDFLFIATNQNLHGTAMEILKLSSKGICPKCKKPLTIQEEENEKRSTKTHILKCVPPYFQDIIDGIKKFEYRKNDRDFVEGDYLLLQEWNKTYSKRTCEVVIIYKMTLEEGIPYGYCVLGISKPIRINGEKPKADGEKWPELAEDLDYWSARGANVQDVILAKAINKIGRKVYGGKN